MAILTWDNPGTRWISGGVDRGVILPSYAPLLGNPFAWTGLTSVRLRNENSGSERPIYMYGSMFRQTMPYLPALTVSAYMYPPGLDIFIDSHAPVDFSYRTKEVNDLGRERYIIYYVSNAIFEPSEITSGSSTDIFTPTTLSWDVKLQGYGALEAFGISSLPTNVYKFSDAKLSAAKMQQLQNIIYGTASTAPRALTQADVTSILG